jgi:glycine cleavage system H protein
MSLPSDLRYTNDHEWVRLDGDVAEVGITDFAQQQLGDVVFVELPDVGATLTAGVAFGNIESVKAVSELFAPLSGTVMEVNTSVKDKPEAVNTAPYTTWLIKVRVSDPAAITSLLDSAAYEPLTK